MFNPRTKRLLIVVIAILAGITVLVIGFSLAKSFSLRSTANEFARNVASGKGDASYEQFSEDGQKVTNKTVWKFQVQGLGQVFKGQEPQLTSISKQNGYTVASYTIASRDKTVYTFTVTLSGSLFGWKVESFTSTVQ